ncbi:MAG: Cysteine synthase, partial [uncultured Acidimicrobiales bacterium]
GGLRIGARPDRQHPDRRRLGAVAEPEGAGPGQARGPEPRREREGPRCQVHDRGGREGRPAAARIGAHRVVLGQHRHRPRHDLQGAGLPPEGGPAGERVDRAAPAARGVGRRD